MKRYRLVLDEIVDKPTESVKEAGAVTMTAAAAMEWLCGRSGRLALDGSGHVWVYLEGKSQFAFPGTDNYHNSLSPSREPFTPLLPATRSRVEMAAELERLKKEQESLLVIYRRAKKESVAMHSENNRQRDEIRSALGSQKAAEAALEVERKTNARFLSILSNAADEAAFIEDSAKDNRAWLVEQYDNMSKDETSGKESG